MTNSSGGVNEGLVREVPVIYKEHLSLSIIRRVSYIALIVLIALGTVGALLTTPGSVLFYVSVGGGGTSILLFSSFCLWETVVQVRACVSLKIKHVDVAAASTSSDSSSTSSFEEEEEPIHKSTSDTSQLIRKKSSPRKIRGAIRKFLKLRGAEIHRRNAHHLVTPYLDPIIAFFQENYVSLIRLPVKEKLDIVQNCLKNDEDFAFLFEKPRGNWNISKKSYHKIFQELFTLCNTEGNKSPQERRSHLLRAMNAVIKTDEYRDAITEILSGENKESLFYRHTQLLLDILMTAWTGVSVCTYGVECVRSILRDGYLNLFAEEKNCDYFVEKRGEGISPDDQELLKMLGAPKSLKTSPITMAHMAAADFKAITRTEKSGSKNFANFHSLRGHLNVGFWPLLVNNYMEALWDAIYRVDGEIFKTRCLRFGTPTKERVGSAQLIGIFIGFLDALAHAEKKIVSFEHQNPKDKKTGQGSEKARLERKFEIPELNEGRYFQVYFPMLFAMDGEWYKQIDEYDVEDWDFKDFREVYLGFFKREDIIDEDLGVSPYRINWEQLEEAGLEKETVINDLRSVLNHVHSLFFEGKKDLTVQDRRRFILISYAFLEEYFVLALKADYSHDQCKDSKDRTLMVLILKRWRDLVRSGKIEDPEERQILRSFIHAAGLLIKGTPMHGAEKATMKGRAKQFLDVLNYLEQSLLEEILDQDVGDTIIRIAGKEYEFLDSFLLMAPNQDLALPPSAANNIEEYEELLQYDAENIPHTCELPNYVSQLVEIQHDDYQSTADHLERIGLEEQIFAILNAHYTTHQDVGITLEWYKEADLHYDKEDFILTVRSFFVITDTSKNEPCRYLKATLRIDIEYDHATLSWTAPSEDVPEIEEEFDFQEYTDQNGDIKMS